MYQFRQFAAEVGLMSYGPDLQESVERAQLVVDGDSEGLKNARGRVNLPASRPGNAAPDQFG